MLISFAEGFLLGLGAAVPLGPINVLIMSTALHRYSGAVAIGAGAITSDMTYLILILFGFLHLVDHPILFDVMSMVGALFMGYFSWSIWKNRNLPIHTVSTQKKTLWGHYLKGYFLTLINPYTLIFWFSVSTYIAARELHTVATVAGLLLSTSLWVTLMPLMIHKTKHLISQRTATLFSIVSSLILLFFTVGMLWKFVV
jgi:L-lysine exporter family protein LysE/ArgO